VEILQKRGIFHEGILFVPVDLAGVSVGFIKKGSFLR
jgi:hypothetical protein